MSIISNLNRRILAAVRRLRRTTSAHQMREWSRVSFFCSFGLLLFALILLVAASPGPLSVELSADMASTNAAFIDLVIFGAGGFFCAGSVLFLAGWQRGTLKRIKAPNRGFDSSKHVLQSNTRRGKSEMAELLQKQRITHE
jgi:hypothetical protein